MNTRLIAVTASLLLLFAGCAGTSGTVATSAAAGSNADASSPSASTTESASADLGTIKFGQSYKWDDGLQVTVTTPGAFKPSEWAVGGKKNAHYVAMTVTLVNGTGKTWDPTMFHLSGQSGDQDADQVFDTAKGVGDSPDTKLLAGRQAKWKVAFAVKNTADLVLEVEPDFDHDSVIYQLG